MSAVIIHVDVGVYDYVNQQMFKRFITHDLDLDSEKLSGSNNFPNFQMDRIVAQKCTLPRNLMTVEFAFLSSIFKPVQ